MHLMIEQIVSIAGALSILIAYGALQAGKLGERTKTYLFMNLFGSAILTYSAIRARQMGLTLVEGAWAAISLGSLARVLLRG